MGRGGAKVNYSGRLLIASACLSWLFAAHARADTPGIPAAMPDGYAVMVFENRSGQASLEWMRGAIPFLLGESLEANPRLRPVYGRLVIPEGAPPAVSGPGVAAVGRELGARWIVAGWFKRASNWDLVVGFQLWEVEGETARMIHEIVDRGDPKDVLAMGAKALPVLCEKAGVPVGGVDAERMAHVATRDHYALTLFGRGLFWMHEMSRKPNAARAEENLKKALFIDPKMAEGHRLLAELYRWQVKLSQARSKYAYALDLMPTYFAALAGSARLLYDEGKLEPAREQFETMLQRRPWDVELRYMLGKVLWESGDADDALIELKRVVRVSPAHLRARRILVLVHASLGRDEDLVAELEQVAELDPGHLETKLDLGAAYAAVGRNQDAIATYSAIVDQQPKHTQALKFLGDLYREGGQLDAAIDCYQRALTVDRKDPRPYFLLGRAYVDSGNLRKAKGIYLRARRFKDYLPDTYNNLGSIAYREGEYGPAEWYLKRAVQKRPGNPRFRYNYALVLSVLHQPDEALREIAAGIHMAPDDVKLNYLRGVVLLRTGDAAGARAAFERVLQVDAEHADAQHNLELLQAMERRAIEGEVVTEVPLPAE